MYLGIKNIIRYSAQQQREQRRWMQAEGPQNQQKYHVYLLLLTDLCVTR